jgi:hypothetical protein
VLSAYAPLGLAHALLVAFDASFKALEALCRRMQGLDDGVMDHT